MALDRVPVKRSRRSARHKATSWLDLRRPTGRRDRLRPSENCARLAGRFSSSIDSIRAPRRPRKLCSDRTRLVAGTITSPARAPGTAPCSSRRLGHLLGRALGDHRSPPSPPSGPRSMTQSAVLTTSRLCSITTHGVALVDQAVQHLEELADVLEVQPGGRLVEHVKRVPGRPLG